MNSDIWLDLFNFQARARTWKHIGPEALEDPSFFKAASLWNSHDAVFLYSDTDLDDDINWKPIRPLGQGGFGIVGLWQKFNRHGDVKDSLAIKQQKYNQDPRTQAKFTYGAHGLAREATLMSQLNVLQKENIIKLRGFKNNGPEELWRFYFEFAPWGDLHVLANNYRAWNTYLPEEFLWQMFNGLATAALALETGPFRNLSSGKPYEDKSAFIVHFDLKPENVFLGDPIEMTDPHFTNYPIVKMADFGLAKLTGLDDDHNPRSYRNLGTSGYRPPVSWAPKRDHGERILTVV